jgi:hypothetical protein
VLLVSGDQVVVMQGRPLERCRLPIVTVAQNNHQSINTKQSSVNTKQSSSTNENVQ